MFEFELGKLYVKEIVCFKYGFKNNLSFFKEGESGVIIVLFLFFFIYKCLVGFFLLVEIFL